MYRGGMTRQISRIPGSLAITAASVVVLAGCASGPSVSPSASPTPEAPVVEGRWSSDETGDPHLELMEDGTVDGSDGCNGISTTYTVDGNVVTLEPAASTLMACEGVDDWLRGAATLEIDGDEAIVFNRDDEEIGTLTRE